MTVDYQLESPLDSSLIEEMAFLYSNHYGVWGSSHEKKGEQISLSPSRLRLWVQSSNSYIATARVSNELVGYAIAVKAFKNKSEKKNTISWITQLVVNEDYRQNGIGKELLFSFWGFSTNYAWGIMSSNPYAIRALEKATYRRVLPRIISARSKGLIKFGIEEVTYLDEETEFKIKSSESKVNTKFPADISDLSVKLENVTKGPVPWMLGEIEEGWEWFAFTFNSQEKLFLTRDEILEMLDISDKIAHKAYSRMLMDSETHAWAKHTPSEIDFIVKNCKLNNRSHIADFGCGIGRHTLELQNRNYNVVGIDYSKDLLDKASSKSSTATFIEGDCRSIELGKKFNLILCLYDVVGSFIDNNENIMILENIFKHLENGGYSLISVMNFELTLANAKHAFSLKEDYNKLLDLTASNTMQTTGNVFNPDYYMIDSDTNIVYRREQFNIGSLLPQELIVRDYRYTKKEIEEMCTNVGFEIVTSRYVQAGRWDVELEATDNGAKEILVLCKKK